MSSGKYAVITGNARKRTRSAIAQQGAKRRAAAPPASNYGAMAMDWEPTGQLNRRGVASKETGFVDLASTGYANDTTGAIVLVATVPQNTNVNSRIGKKIVWKSIQMRGRMNAGSTSTVCDAACLLVYDRRPTGSLPAITDILNTATASSFNNDANSGRFKILRRWDKTFSGNTATPATGNEIMDLNEYVNLRGLPGVFKAAGTGAIGDIEEGAIYFVSVGDQAPGTAAAGTTVGFRTRFVDV